MYVVIEVGRRIERGDERVVVYLRRLRRGVLGEEIVSVVGVVVARAAVGGLGLPRHGSAGVEESLAIYVASGNFLKVVVLDEVLGVECLVDEIAAIAVQLHLVYIREASLTHKSGCELVYARLCHTYLRPSSFAQHAMLGIALRCRQRVQHVHLGVCTLAVRCSIAACVEFGS